MIELTVDEIAKVAHEVNKAYCEALGDTTQVSWEDAPGWQKDSAVDSVIFHQCGDHDASASHEAWWQEKRNAGWVYGPIKDAEKKTHPCCVVFSALPVEQKAKNYIFKAVVKELSGD